MVGPVTLASQTRMGGLTHIEKQKLERELGMGGGYVLAFSNKTFGEFFREVVGIEIYSLQHTYGSASKANQMRAFWQIASDTQLRLLVRGLLEGWELYAGQPISDSSRVLLVQIAKRLGDNVDFIDSQQKEEVRSISQQSAEKLSKQLVGLTAFAPQERGYKFELFLKELFDAYSLTAERPFDSLASRSTEASCRKAKLICSKPNGRMLQLEQPIYTYSKAS